MLLDPEKRQPKIDIPLLGDGDDAASITSDASPKKALYQIGLDEAFSNGKATVILFASPAHCDSDMCRASLNSLKSVSGSFSNDANFIHVESRNMDNPEGFSDAFEEWGLVSEPWFYFAQ